MKVELIEITQLSGQKSHFYTVIIDGAEETLYTAFTKEHIGEYADEIREMMTRMYLMGHRQGSQEWFFKMREGTITDNVVALYDRPDRKLRLYCLRYGNATVILGGGGPKSTRTYQEDPKLHSNVLLLQRISKIIDEAIRNKELRIDENGRIFCEQILEDYEDD